jgi:predicted small lipoprotein YifL
MAYSVSALGEYNPRMKRTGMTYPAGLLCCLMLGLAACGQRGPLYLPEPQEQAVTTENADAEEEHAGENAEDGHETTP